VFKSLRNRKKIVAVPHSTTLNKCHRRVNFVMYLRAILCTFQISVDFYYLVTLAALVPFKGPKKSRFLGPSPLKCPELWIVPPQNHFVPPHINNRYINSYNGRPIPVFPFVFSGFRRQPSPPELIMDVPLIFFSS
jgi:hypothetical protein